jgi:hypothetical protein
MLDPVLLAERIERCLQQAKMSLATHDLHQPDYHLSVLTQLISELPGEWHSTARVHVGGTVSPPELVRALTHDVEQTSAEDEIRFRIYTALLRLAIVLFRTEEELPHPYETRRRLHPAY